MWPPWMLLLLAVAGSAQYQNVAKSSDSIFFPATATLNLRTPSLESVNNTEDLKSKFRDAVEAIFGITFRLKALLNDTATEGQDGNSRNTNFLSSPVSLVATVAQLLLASRGDTRRGLIELLRPINSSDALKPVTMLQFHQQLGELLKVLQKGNDASTAGSYDLNMSGALFHDKNITLFPAFQYAISDLYGLNILSMDFLDDPVGSQKGVNEWVANRTHNLVTSIIKDPLPQTTIALLTNTVYFKGAWETPFIPDLTVKRMFSKNKTHQVEVSLMRGHFEDLFYVESKRLACRMIVLPYKHNKAAMYIVLPSADIGDYDIRDFASRMTFADVEELVSSTKPHTVTVSLPRMKLMNSFSIRSPLLRRQEQTIRAEGTKESTTHPPKKANRPYQTTINGQVYICRGLDCSNGSSVPTQSQDSESMNFISNATTNAPTTHQKEIQKVSSTPQPSPATESSRDFHKAYPGLELPSSFIPKAKTPRSHSPCSTEVRKNSLDLSGASTYPNFNFNDILHHVLLEVNEVGTEAAAVTISSVDYSGDVINFRVDKPFLFFIVHQETSAPLFWGIVEDPTAGTET